MQFRVFYCNLVQSSAIYVHSCLPMCSCSQVFTRFVGPLVPGNGTARARTEDAFYAADSADAFAWNTCACCLSGRPPLTCSSLCRAHSAANGSMSGYNGEGTTMMYNVPELFPIATSWIESGSRNDGFRYVFVVLCVTCPFGAGK